MFTNEELLVSYGKYQYFINPRLLTKMGIDKKGLERLKNTHIAKLKIFEKMEATDDHKELKGLAGGVAECEFQLQEIWGFGRDDKMHRWWEVPKCKCPGADNRDLLGSGIPVIDHRCPVHVGEFKDEYLPMVVSKSL